MTKKALAETLAALLSQAEPSPAPKRARRTAAPAPAPAPAAPAAPARPDNYAAVRSAAANKAWETRRRLNPEKFPPAGAAKPAADPAWGQLRTAIALGDRATARKRVDTLIANATAAPAPIAPAAPSPAERKAWRKAERAAAPAPAAPAARAVEIQRDHNMSAKAARRAANAEAREARAIAAAPVTRSAGDNLRITATPRRKPAAPAAPAIPYTNGKIGPTTAEVKRAAAIAARTAPARKREYNAHSGKRLAAVKPANRTR